MPAVPERLSLGMLRFGTFAWFGTDLATSRKEFEARARAETARAQEVGVDARVRVHHLGRWSWATLLLSGPADRVETFLAQREDQSDAARKAHATTSRAAGASFSWNHDWTFTAPRPPKDIEGIEREG